MCERNERIEMMANQPMTAQIDALNERRMRDAGVMPPVFSEYSNENERTSRTAAFEEKRDRYRHDAELFLTSVYESDQAKEADAASRDRVAFDAQVDQLQAAFLDQPSKSEADFERALPRLIERAREETTLAGATQLEAAKAAARASGRYSL